MFPIVHAVGQLDPSGAFSIPGVHSALVDAASGWIHTIWACQEHPAQQGPWGLSN